MSNTIAESKSRIHESTPGQFDLVGMLLAEQHSLTAIERFSALHDADDGPAQAKYYRSLMPATPPTPGQQYAFSVDLDACSGCKACVVACHTMNGLEEDESWRRAGTLTVGRPAQSRIQHVTTACHHCEDPGCLNGCPVKAYDKDPANGIVRHLDDQCIGCKYCTMMCPYEVPQYSDRLGIVRKCDMCHQRLSAGEAPACVQSCPNEAISIRLVQSGAVSFADDDRLVPGAPKSVITRPTTSYVSAHQVSGDLARAQDAEVDQVAESHWPLAVMLVATQVSVGMLFVERLAAALLWLAGSSMPIGVSKATAIVALIFGVIGLNVAPLHLGQPLRAWRVFLGLRTSWLSREAVVLGKYIGTLAVGLALMFLPAYANYLPGSIVTRIPSWAAGALVDFSLVLGVFGLFSSAMIYVATRRWLWRPSRTFTRFFGTAVVCGLIGFAATLIHAQAPTSTIVPVLWLVTISASAKLAWEYRFHLRRHADCRDGFDRRSNALVNDRLMRWKSARLSSALIGTVLALTGSLTLLMGWSTTSLVVVVFAAACLIAGEFCERFLYFASVVHDRMPGTLR